MKTIHFLGLLLIGTMLIFSCGGETENDDIEFETDVSNIGIDTVRFLAELAELESKIDLDSGMPKEKDMKKAITSFQDFAAIFPEDEKAPDYLLRASDISLTTSQPEKSVSILKQIMDKYPAYNKMEDVMYNYASHLDFELRDTTLAKEAYKNFIAKYPNSGLVNDCNSRIENIRYSMEELTEIFMERLEKGDPNYLP